MEQARGDVEASLHPAGEFVHDVATPFGELHSLQRLVDPHPQVFPTQPIQPAKEPEVGFGGQVQVEGDRLRYQADELSQAGVAAFQSLSVEQDFTAGRSPDPGD